MSFQHAQTQEAPSISVAMAAETSHPLDRELFLAAKSAWKSASRNKTPSASAHVAWNLLRGLPADRGFSPVVNPRKLANGMSPWGAFEAAKRNAQAMSSEALLPFAELLEKQGAKLAHWRWDIPAESQLFKALKG